MTEAIHLDINQIKRLLPNRYPMLMVDRVVDGVRRQWVKAIKNVAINEPYFQGHFPTRPVMPGVMIIETMAQVSGILVMLERKDDQQNFLLAGCQNVRFKRVVEPGDQLLVKSVLMQQRSTLWRFDVRCEVADQVVSTGELLIAATHVEEGIR